MDQHPVDRLETPKQLAKRVGISEGKVRQLVQAGQLDCVMIGCRIHIPVDEWSRFIAAKRGKLCHDETKVQDCGISKSVAATTSPGLSTVAAASARLARQTATKLKSLSGNGCSAEDAEKAQVIPLRSS
jgi:excisionase family DNA binding protein